MADISIIIPLFNKQEAIAATIDSVLAQSLDVFEVIIVDDGSTDNSRMIVESFKDLRISYYFKPNGGVSSARNYGIPLSKGQYILFLDADDRLTPDCLEVLWDLHLRYPDADVLTGNHVSVSEDGSTNLICRAKVEKVVKNPAKYFWEWKFMPRTGASIFRKEKVELVKGFDERISIFEDLEFDLKLMNCCKYVYTPKVVYEHYTQYSELSVKPKPIDKYFPYYIQIKDQSFYQKLILYSVTNSTYYKFKDFGDEKVCKYLNDNILTKYPLMQFIHFFYSRYIFYLRKYNL